MPGFLKDNEALSAVRMETQPCERLNIAAGASRAERTVAVTWNSYGGVIAPLADELAIERGAAVAVLSVESAGAGFGPAGRLLIRFENHIFDRRWGRQNRSAFDAHFRYGDEPWRGHRFRRDANAAWLPCHTDQHREWEAFSFAQGFDDEAAKLSISMGSPQIMGFNYSALGYGSVGQMFKAFELDVRAQLNGLFDFIRSTSQQHPEMLDGLRRGDYEIFAKYYNGAGRMQAYGRLIRAHVNAFRTLASTPAPGLGGPTTYVVQPGDTLGAIAAQCGVTVDALVELNDIANPNFIAVGDVLRLPERDAAPSTEGGEADESVTPTPCTHRVAPGDTLSAIARRFGTSVDALVAANGIANRNLINVDDVLLIPTV